LKRIITTQDTLENGGTMNSFELEVMIKDRQLQLMEEADGIRQSRKANSLWIQSAGGFIKKLMGAFIKFRPEINQPDFCGEYK
jgi:hypothetical protein